MRTRHWMRLGCALLGLVWVSLRVAGENPAPLRDGEVLNAEKAGSIWLDGLEGERLQPFPPGTRMVQVFVFVSNDCPIANRYAPEIRRLAERFEGRGVRFWVVHSMPDETLESVRSHAKAYALPGVIVRDGLCALAGLLGVTVTPEAAVVDGERRLVYRGRIDDRFPALGQRRARATTHDLRDALEAVLAGRSVSTPRTQAVGCRLPPAP